MATHKSKGNVLWRKKFDNTILAATPDAIIIPHGIAKLSYALHTRVVVEYKTFAGMPQPDVTVQAIVELLLASSCTSVPVLVLLTDLNSKFHIYCATDKNIVIYCNHTKAQAFGMVRWYLQRDQCANIDIDQTKIPESEVWGGACILRLLGYLRSSITLCLQYNAARGHEIH